MMPMHGAGPSRRDQEREAMAVSVPAPLEDRASGATAGRAHNYARRYWMFAVPAAVVVAAVILFPWLFTLFMSVHDWKVSGNVQFVGLANYAKMLSDERFLWAIVRTL